MQLLVETAKANSSDLSDREVLRPQPDEILLELHLDWFALNTDVRTATAHLCNGHDSQRWHQWQRRIPAADGDAGHHALLHCLRLQKVIQIRKSLVR